MTDLERILIVIVLLLMIAGTIVTTTLVRLTGRMTGDELDPWSSVAFWAKIVVFFTWPLFALWLWLEHEDEDDGQPGVLS